MQHASAARRLGAVAISLALAAAIGAAAARAGSCRVLVALGSLDIEPSPAGLSVRIGGIWEFDNLVQVSTGLGYNVLLVRGDKFVRLSYPNQGYVGHLSGLGARIDAGIDGNDILAVEASGWSEPAARFVSIEAQKLKLTAPVPPAEGPVSVVAYLVLDGDYMSPIVSNVLTRPLALVPTNPNSDETVDDGSTTVIDVPPDVPPKEEPPTKEDPREPGATFDVAESPSTQEAAPLRPALEVAP